MKIALALLLCAPFPQDVEEGFVPLVAPEVSSREAIEPEVTGNVLEIYDVGDLVGLSKLQEIERIIEESRETRPEAKAVMKLLKQRDHLAQAVETGSAGMIEVVSAYMLPPFEEGETQVRMAGAGSLVVYASEAQQAWLKRFLEQQRTRPGMVLLESFVMHAETGTFARLGIVGDTMPVATKEEWQRLLAQAKKAGGDVLMVPSITAGMRQRTELRALEEIAYVQDWEFVTVQPGDLRIADPVIGVLQDGVRCDLRVTPLEHDRFGLELHVSHSSLTQPIPTLDKRQDDGTVLSVALPEVKLMRVETNALLNQDAGIAFVARDADGGEMCFCVRLHYFEGPDDEVFERLEEDVRRLSEMEQDLEAKRRAEAKLEKLKRARDK